MEKNAWDFIEEYLINYYHNDLVARHDDLYKIIANEEAVNKSILQNEFGGNKQDLQAEADKIYVKLLEQAIKDFYSIKFDNCRE